jgi:hypothetical protein
LAEFNDHIIQVKRNLAFLQQINQEVPDCCDWQVTVCFYTSLHLVNAHLSKFSLQYRKHSDVNYALNFANRTSPGKLPEEEYLAYTSLQSLSRRSRYLVSEKDGNLSSDKAFLIFEVHLAKALRHLDKLLGYFKAKYSIELEEAVVICKEIKRQEELKHLTLKIA